LLALALVHAAATDARAESVGEADVIRIAKTRDPIVLAAREGASAAQTGELGAGLYPNPSASWEREATPGGPSVRDIQDSIFLTVPVELGGRRSAQKALARSGTSEARAHAARTQGEAVAASLRLFYDALAADRDARIAQESVTRLDEAGRVVRRRHEEGTISGYERARLELETELARSRLRAAEAEARTARATLAAMLGVQPGSLELRGDLTTADPPTKRAPGQARPWIHHLRASETEAREAGESAGSAWIPALSLSGGLRIATTTETRYGYVAGASLSIPAFSRGQELRAESHARQRVAAAETLAAERVIHVEEVRASEEFAAARAEMARFGEATGERVKLLERAVESGYREGDRSIVELVDAQRARTDVDRRRLDLELAAKRAEIRLRAARGEFE